MSSAMWFAVTVPKEEYELRTVKEQQKTSKTSSKASLISEANSNKDLMSKNEKETKEIKNDKEKGSQESVHSSRDGVSSLIYFVEKQGPMEKTLKESLLRLGIVDAVWTSEGNENFHHVYFPCDSGERCDEIMNALALKGFGVYGNSTLAVLPCAVFYQHKNFVEKESDCYSESEADTEDTLDKQPSGSKPKADIKKSMKGFKSMQKQFLKSVTARLTVAQVVESVKAGTQITFDYLMFVMLASMIAAFGLMENSSVSIVASMLISPLMGPILAGTFGAVIRDHSLLSQGLKAELIGLFLCTFIGFIIGLICGNFSTSYSSIPFPTPEMAARGQDRALWVGVLIALPSGAGVALSVLGGNAGSLVGVAISASLLPPAVNAGLLWGLAAIKHIGSYSAGNEWFELEDGNSLMMNTALMPPKGYVFAYRPNMDKECAILGVVSLLLTIVNIICIIIAAMVVLKVKEFAPKTSLPSTSRFWKRDIKIARDYNKTVNQQEGKELGVNFLSEWATLTGMNPDTILNGTKEGQMTQFHTLQNMLQDAEEDDVYQTVMQYVPGNHPRNMPRRVTLATLPCTKAGNELYSQTNHGDIEQGDSTSPVRKAIQRFKRPNRRDSTVPYADTSPSKTSPTNEPEFEEVQLRHPSGATSGGARVSSLLRRSLQTSGGPPYSLWPPRSKIRRMTNATANNRFLVTPVDEPLVLPPLPPRPRYSKHYGQVESNI